MKKILALILALAMCLSLCACGSRNIASPGTADKETSDDVANSTTGDAENTDAVSNEDDAVSSDSATDANNDSNASNDSENANDSNSESNTPTISNNTPGGAAEAPESTEEYQFISGGASIDISYGDDMSASEVGDGSVCVAYDHCRLYVQNVTSEFDPDKDAPETFLYDYAYNKCVDLVVATFGEITQFTGEYNLAPEGNEIYGYGANMTCGSQIQVYTFIKLVTLDDGEGYAVMIGICDDYNAGIFDNIEVQ